MTDAPFVISGWVLTGAVLSGYALRLWARSRKSRRLLPPEERSEWT